MIYIHFYKLGNLIYLYIQDDLYSTCENETKMFTLKQFNYFSV